MRNYLSDGAIVTRTAPVGGVVSGVPLVIGSEFLVPQSTAAAGALVACVRVGKVRLPAASGEVWTEGAKVFYNPTSGDCEAEDADDNYLIGTAEGAQSGGTVDVVLNGVSLAATDGDLDAKADKAVPTAAGNIAILTAGGNLDDSEFPIGDLALAADVPTADGTSIVDTDGVWSVDTTISEGAAAGATAAQPEDIPTADGTTLQDTDGVWSVIGGTGDVSSADADPRTDGDLLAWDANGDVVSTGTPAANVLTNVEPSDLAALEGDGFTIPLVISTFINAGVGGNPDDVTIYAVDSLLFPFVVFKYEALWSAGTGVGVTAEVRTAAAGAGTLLATIDASTSDAASLIADSDVVVPGETVGLFLRRSDDALAGLVVLHCLKVESGV